MLDLKCVTIRLDDASSTSSTTPREHDSPRNTASEGEAPLSGYQDDSAIPPTTSSETSNSEMNTKPRRMVALPGVLRDETESSKAKKVALPYVLSSGTPRGRVKNMGSSSEYSATAEEGHTDAAPPKTILVVPFMKSKLESSSTDSEDKKNNNAPSSLCALPTLGECDEEAENSDGLNLEEQETPENVCYSDDGSLKAASFSLLIQKLTGTREIGTNDFFFGSDL